MLALSDARLASLTDTEVAGKGPVVDVGPSLPLQYGLWAFQSCGYVKDSVRQKAINDDIPVSDIPSSNSAAQSPEHKARRTCIGPAET